VSKLGGSIFFPLKPFALDGYIWCLFCCLLSFFSYIFKWYNLLALLLSGFFVSVMGDVDVVIVVLFACLEIDWMELWVNVKCSSSGWWV
jgi:hypothetical protein